MRKLHQRQLLELLETIREAQKKGLYGDCQEGALAMIEFIDHQEGKGTRTADLLQEYSYLLYQAHNGEIDRDPLRKQLYRIESSIKTDLRPNKYKVLFLPYYDNTWESMKSVYEAFSQDPLFETEVVIIPIIRNTNEGPKFVWEDYLTPAGILNTHYDQYSFEIDQPDVVFLNQPYDGVNVPKFRSENIRKYTGLMVYIPYYGMKLIGSRSLVTGETRLESIHRCDLFIAQSDVFREYYLKGTPSYSRALVCGHPKCDVLYAARTKGAFTRHPDWEEAIGDRKVILLNTHYSYMVDGAIPHPGLKRLLEAIVKNDDLFLIWRPHPQAFLMKMTPHVHAMLEFASAHKRMVVDRTPSIMAAFMYANAVISLFPSSIVMDALFLDLPTFVMGLDDYDGSSTSSSSHFMAIAHEDTSQPLPSSNANSDAMRRYIEESIYRPLDMFIKEVQLDKDSKRESRREFRKREFPNIDGTVAESILESIKRKLSSD